ncbi:MAG: copper-binding protein [Rhodospirillaceae bacterium]
MKPYKTLAVLGVSLLLAPQLEAGTTNEGARALILIADHSHNHGDQAGAKGKGVVNSVDAVGHKLNMSHEPIPSLGWPAMKMDFEVAPSVDLKSVEAGTQVEFVVGKNKAGLPEIQSIQSVRK